METVRILVVAKTEDAAARCALAGFAEGARVVSVRLAVPSVGFYVEVEGDRKAKRVTCRHRRERYVTNGTMSWTQTVPCRKTAGPGGYCRDHGLDGGDQ